MTFRTRLLVFALGAASLAGQVSWSRLTATVVGGTFGAWALTLFGAMAGLSLGAGWAGLRPTGSRRRLAAILGACAATLIAMPHLILSLGRLEGAPATRGVAAALILAAAHFPFGAFLPSMAASGSPATRNLGALYALSSLGAVAGALGAGEFLQAVMALDHLGVLLGLMVLAAAALLPASAPAADRPGGSEPRPISGSLVLVAFSMGILGLAAESLWLRVLGFYWESNTRCFALVTGATVGGFSLGSWAAGLLSRRRTTGRRDVGIALGLAAVAVAAAAGAAPLAVGATSAIERVVATFLMVGVPAAASGAAFILLLECAGVKGGSVRALGFISGANSAGAAAGPLLLWAGGAWVSWPAQFLLVLAAGYAVLVGAVAGRRAALTGLALASALGVWSGLSTAGPALTDFHPTARAGSDVDTVTIPFLRPSLESTVTVTRETRTGLEIVWIDRGFQGDTSPLGRRIPERLGRLPCELLGRPPERAMVIGLGTGVTLSSIVEAGASSVDVAELSRGVLEANRTVLAEINGHVLSNKAVRVRHGDGRPLLLDAASPYDLIVTDMIFPTVLGAGNLFTREFYDLARRRLTPDGVFVHWVPCFLLSPEDLASVTRAFLDVFPRGSACIGYFGPRRFILGLAAGSVQPDGCVLGPAELAALAAGATATRDADPRLETRSRESGDGKFGVENLERIMGLMDAAAARGWRCFGEAGLAELAAEGRPPGSAERRSLLDRAVALYREASSLGVADAAFQLSSLAFERSLETAREASDRRDADRMFESLRRAAAHQSWGTGNVFLADVLVGRGRLEEAAQELRKAVAKSPRAADAHLRLGLVARELGDHDTARREFDRAAALREGFAPTGAIVSPAVSRRPWSP